MDTEIKDTENKETENQETEFMGTEIRRSRRRPVRRRSKAPVIIGVLLLLLLLGGGAYFLAPLLFGDGESGGLISGIDILPKPERMNVLLLGDDARRGETMARTDSIMLVSIDSKLKRVAMLSIPRDSYVAIPGHGKDKINHASVYGGPELTAKTVSQLLGITVNSYIIIGYDGFKNVVDILGGVDYDVETDMYHWDPEDGSAYQINLKKGMQHLDGSKALQYVRYRGYASGDIARTEHQQRFFVALANELLQPSSVLKLPSLVPELSHYVKTNLSTSDLLKLASTARFFEDGDFVAQTLPGWNMDINGISYWGVDVDNARVVLAKLINGETVSTVVLSSPSSYSQSGNSATVNRETAEEPSEPQENGDKADQDQNEQQSEDKTPETSSPLGQGIAKPANTNPGSETTGGSTPPAPPAPSSSSPTPQETSTPSVDINQTGIVGGDTTAGDSASNPAGIQAETAAPDLEPETEKPNTTPGIPGARPKA